MTPTPQLARTRAIVLAAGLGTRMKSRLPKVLHPICGRPMIDYVLDAAEAATGSRPLVVWSPPVARDDEGEIERIVEAKDATEDELEIDEINSGLYVFDAGWVRARIGDLLPSAVTGELYAVSYTHLTL